MGLLDLADFRERVVALYREGPQDGEEGALDWRRRREELFRTHPESPLAGKPGSAPSYFTYDAGAVVEARLEPTDGGIEVDTGGEDGVVRYARIGIADTPFGALTLFWTRGYGGGLFMPVRDATSGQESYGGGRYLTDTIKGTFGRGVRLDRADHAAVTLDFNYLFNPSCAYDDRWLCPLAPPENRLEQPIRAGELTFEPAT
jgi:uncharacterized protein (DUF1684 family)